MRTLFQNLIASLLLFFSVQAFSQGMGPIGGPTPDRGFANCYGNICVGQRAYNIQRSYREVEVIAIESAGTFVLRFLDNGGVGGGWSHTDLAVMYGCSGQHCVGSWAYNVKRDSRIVTVVGIQSDGRMVLRFNDNGGIGGGWQAQDLALPQGCSGSFCVGSYAYNISRSYRAVTVVGIQTDGRMVLQFQDNGAVGANWQVQDLAVTQGCGRQFCVGDMALNTQRNYRQVTIVGIHADGKYVVRFADNGGVGGGWSDSDLVRY